MKKNLLTVWMVLLIALVAISPAAAGGVSGKIGLGSITFDGVAYGFSSGPVTITLFARGIPEISCHNPGNNSFVPGQNPVAITGEASATYELPADENGKFTIGLEAEPSVAGISAKKLGCPNNSWTASVSFVYWDYVKLTVTDDDSGKVLWQKDSACTTTRNPDDIFCPAFEK